MYFIDVMAESIASPARLETWVFLLMIMAVIYTGQRLVEHASLLLHPQGKHFAFSKVAIAIGVLIWIVDLIGLLTYPLREIKHAFAMPMVISLIMVVAGVRYAVSSLAITKNFSRVLRASFIVAVFAVSAHFVLLHALFNIDGPMNWSMLFLAFAATASFCVLMAWQHKQHRLLRLSKEVSGLALWKAPLLASLIIVLLYTLFMAALPVAPVVVENGRGHLMAYMVLICLGAALVIEHWQGLKLDSLKQHLLDKAIKLSWSGQYSVAHKERLAHIAELLPRLIASRQFNLHFQPIVNVRSSTCYFEALLRVQDKKLGAVSPEEFFMVCERVGLHCQMDRVIIQKALEYAIEWQEGWPVKYGISVNVNADTMLESDFVEWLFQLVRDCDYPADQLKLELTEHAMITNSERLKGVIQRLRHLGIGVLMDDFGAGFSSLGMLADIPIEGIKCDRLFVQNLQHDKRRKALLRHICMLAKELELSVTVEGVEEQETYTVICNKGVGFVQGYYFARPMPADQVRHWSLFHAAEAGHVPLSA